MIFLAEYLIPLEIAASIGTALVGAIVWLARLAISALRENRETAEKLHAEVVGLTREVLTAVATNTAALEAVRNAKA